MTSPTGGGPARARELDILCLGEPLVELNQQDERHYLQGFGGDTSNCAIAAARQGARAGYMTRLGQDTFAERLMALWRQEGVDTAAIQRDPKAPTGMYLVSHGPEGHSFSYYRAGSAAALMTPQDIRPEMVKRAGLLHVSAISQAISESAADAVFAAIEMAREAGVRVSYDTNLRLNLWPLARARAIIHAAIEMSDIVLPGLDDAIKLTGLSEPEAIADFYLGRGAGLVALTLGREGALVATPDERRRIPPFQVRAVDATGAGDTFDGAFLSELARGSDPFAAGRYANAAAALSTTGYGAVSPIPRREAVEAFLREKA